MIRHGGAGTPQVGETMPDGTIHAGVSPDTHRPIYTTPDDAHSAKFRGGEQLSYTFNEARKYAGKLDAHGHRDWRVPTKNELNMLWENRNEGALKGTFDLTGLHPAGWYRSSSQGNDASAWAQRFRDGDMSYCLKDSDSSLRLVR